MHSGRKKALNFTKLKVKPKPKIDAHLESTQAKISTFFQSKKTTERSDEQLDCILKKNTVNDSSPKSCADISECPPENIDVSFETKQKLNDFALGYDKSISQTVFKNPNLKIQALKSPQEYKTTHEKRESSIFQSKKGPISVTTNIKYTPLEQQYLDIKKQYPDAILFVECGYKYRFFGQDAEVASRDLNIGCNVDQNLSVASIPTHRLHIHVRRLVALGHKVGVVKQTETSALKAIGERKSDLFKRQLTALYTKATLIGHDVDCEESGAQDCARYMVCIYEVTNSSLRNKVSIALTGVCPSTGEACYWWGEEGFERNGLLQCLLQLRPAEILYSEQSLSQVTKALLQHIQQNSISSGDVVRLEELKESSFEYAPALLQVTALFADNPEGLSKLTPATISAMSALLTYLKEFKLENLLKSSCQLEPLLNLEDVVHFNPQTVRNLEIFQNMTDFKEHGSLFWALNKTKTAFGRRLLQQWLCKPLNSTKAIVSRQDIVSEILPSTSSVLKSLRDLLQHLPDLENMLCATLQSRVSCEKFYNLTENLSNIYSSILQMKSNLEKEIANDDLKDVVKKIPELLQHVPRFLNNINKTAAKSTEITSLFKDVSKFPEIIDCRKEIERAEDNLEKQKPSICRALGVFAFNYSCISGHEYLIEVKKSQVSSLPKSWKYISGTKQLSRYRSPEVEDLFTLLSQLRERHKKLCQEAWITFLGDFNVHFFAHKQAVKLLATLDCFFSLVDFAQQDGFCRPIILEKPEKCLKIVDGRHPIIEKLMTGDQQYVPNDVELNPSRPCLVLTGPNMGGKSSYVRQIALCAVLAHVGAHVPAKEAQISALDGIYTRMGAQDQILERQSTFMIEMQETSDILQKASPYSLLILDELGRGTSTHDGTAVAGATLHYILTKLKSLTLFVTHYLPVTQVIGNGGERPVNYHMSFLLEKQEETSKEEDESRLTFLYRLKEGPTDGSYGMNVARLAGLPQSLSNTASDMARHMHTSAEQKRLKRKWFMELIQGKSSEVVNQFIISSI